MERAARYLEVGYWGFADPKFFNRGSMLRFPHDSTTGSGKLCDLACLHLWHRHPEPAAARAVDAR